MLGFAPKISAALFGALGMEAIDQSAISKPRKRPRLRSPL